MHQITIHHSVLDQRHDCVDIVAAHFADILEEKRHRLEYAVLHVELGNAVLIQQPRKHLANTNISYLLTGGLSNGAWSLTVNGEHVSATMAIATQVQTRFWRSWTFKLLRSVASTSYAQGQASCGQLQRSRWSSNRQPPVDQ